MTTIIIIIIIIVLSIMYGNKDNNSLQFNKLYKIMKLLYLRASFRFLAWHAYIYIYNFFIIVFQIFFQFQNVIKIRSYFLDHPIKPSTLGPTQLALGSPKFPNTRTLPGHNGLHVTHSITEWLSMIFAQWASGFCTMGPGHVEFEQWLG
jgi:hypothetical protein